MTEEQLEIREEMEEQMRCTLLKVCKPEELEDFKEWIEEETNWELYWNDGWINTKTHQIISLQSLYKLYENNKNLLCQ